MQFHQNGDLFSVIRITGPQHNLLQFLIRKGRSESTQPSIKALESLSKSQPVLDHGIVSEHILAGLTRARADLGKLPPIDEIRFVVSDTGPEMLYEDLTYALVFQVASAGETD